MLRAAIMHKRCYMLELIVDKAQSLKDFTDTNYAQASFCFHTLLKNKEITLGEKVNFVVPTGNFGNILAGYYAKEM